LILFCFFDVIQVHTTHIIQNLCQGIIDLKAIPFGMDVSLSSMGDHEQYVGLNPGKESHQP